MSFSKDAVIRRFTVQTFSFVELLALSIKDIMKMKLEFPHAFRDLFSNVKKRLKEELFFKLDVIKQWELERAKEEKKPEEGKAHKLSSMVTCRFVGSI